MTNVLSDLNTDQYNAAVVDKGPVIIIAGPGTGKTKTLTARIANLISEYAVRPDQILALTFTNKAAQEMKHRVQDQLSVRDLQIKTFHALCYELLGDNRSFISDAQRLNIIKGLKKSKDLKSLSTRELGLVISKFKNSVLGKDLELSGIVDQYNQVLINMGMTDFDDLLRDAYELLKTDDQRRAEVQARYQHVLVDEFQDTNSLQYEFLKLILGHNNIFVIGDPNQSIYGFRGASGGIFGQFKADFPSHKQIVLNTNYRSSQDVVRLANALFPNAPSLNPSNQSKGIVRVVSVLNEYSEAEWILDQIQQAIGGADFLKAVNNDNRKDHRKLSDFAILYRSRSAARTFQKLLDESGLPYQVVGDGSPYDSSQVQALIVLLKSALNSQSADLQGYASAQRRLIEQELVDSRDADPSLLVERLIKILGLEPSKDLLQLASVLVRFKDLPSAVAYLDSIAEQGFYDPSADAITLLTIHASKGLEFAYVFLLGAEQGILPSSLADTEEERRLFYVAATRAKESLEIIYAKNRGGKPKEVSVFIKELPKSTLEQIVDPGMQDQVRRIAKRKAKNSQTSLF